MFKVAEAYGDSGFLQTMTPDPSAATGVVQTYTVNNPYGVGMPLEADFGVTVLYMTANPGMVRHGIPGTMGVLTKPTDEGCVRSAVEYALHLRRGEPAPVVPEGLQMFG